MNIALTRAAPCASRALMQQALDGVRVLDLSDEKGAYCGKLLADMGADVIKIEPPRGDPTRRIGPFAGDSDDPERSLFFWQYNTSKRGITLDVSQPHGQALFRLLAQRADVVLETFAPGTLAGCGLSYADLQHDNPRLIVASLTAFGQTGPYRDWQSSDTVAEALGGMIYLNGHANEPPLRALGVQAYHSASAYAAIAVMLALLSREDSGRGQWIDVSLQECVAATVEHASSVFHQTGRIEERHGTLHWSRSFRAAACQDGYVMQCTLGDWTSLIEWVKADGKAQDLVAPEWEHYEYRRNHCEHVFDVLAEWAKAYTVSELVEGAQLRRIPYAPVLPPETLPDNPQLQARGFFTAVAHDDAGTVVRYPGAPFQLSETPWRLSRRAPHIGEHNAEVYAEIGVDENALETLRAAGIV